MTSTEAAIFTGMFFVLLAMLYAYAWEYVRYKTGVRKTRPVKKVMFGWLAVIGLYIGIVACAPLTVVAWLIAGLGYAWDSYIVDRLP